MLAELLKATPAGAASFIVQIADASLREGLPLRWRGSRMVEVPRKPGAPMNYTNSRGAACGEEAGKVVSKALRAEIMPSLAPLLRGWQ